MKLFCCKQLFVTERRASHIYLHPEKEHKYTFIWLHGLGDSADGYLDIFQDPNFPIKLTNDLTRIILLTAPIRKLSKYEGYEMTSWFDMKRQDWMDQYDKVNFDQLIGIDEANESKEMIYNVIQDEKIDSKNIILGGFSQGCALALHSGLCYQEQLGGILGYSGFLFKTTKSNDKSINTPITLSHGTMDPVIHWKFAKKTYEELKNHKGKVEQYPIKQLEHSFSLESFEIMKKFLSKHFS